MWPFKKKVNPATPKPVRSVVVSEWEKPRDNYIDPWGDYGRLRQIIIHYEDGTHEMQWEIKSGEGADEKKSISQSQADTILFAIAFAQAKEVFRQYNDRSHPEVRLPAWMDA